MTLVLLINFLRTWVILTKSIMVNLVSESCLESREENGVMRKIRVDTWLQNSCIHTFFVAKYILIHSNTHFFQDMYFQRIHFRMYFEFLQQKRMWNCILFCCLQRVVDKPELFGFSHPSKLPKVAFYAGAFKNVLPHWNDVENDAVAVGNPPATSIVHFLFFGVPLYEKCKIQFSEDTIKVQFPLVTKYVSETNWILKRYTESNWRKLES